jgi:hypothetical protein
MVVAEVGAMMWKLHFCLRSCSKGGICVRMPIHERISSKSATLTIENSNQKCQLLVQREWKKNYCNKNHFG